MDIQEFIFNRYKDEVIIAKTFKREVMKKYHLSLNEARDIFVRINNYQIENFGVRLTINKDTFPPYTGEELNRIRVNANARRYQRSNKV